MPALPGHYSNAWVAPALAAVASSAHACACWLPGTTTYCWHACAHTHARAHVPARYYRDALVTTALAAAANARPEASTQRQMGAPMQIKVGICSTPPPAKAKAQFSPTYTRTHARACTPKICFSPNTHVHLSGQHTLHIDTHTHPSAQHS